MKTFEKVNTVIKELNEFLNNENRYVSFEYFGEGDYLWSVNLGYVGDPFIMTNRDGEFYSLLENVEYAILNGGTEEMYDEIIKVARSLSDFVREKGWREFLVNIDLELP